MVITVQIQIFTRLSVLVIGYLDLEIVWDLWFEIWNLEIESLSTVDDERLSLSQSLP
jgi:hypothetical protein